MHCIFVGVRCCRNGVLCVAMAFLPSPSLRHETGEIHNLNLAVFGVAYCRVSEGADWTYLGQESEHVLMV